MKEDSNLIRVQHLQGNVFSDPHNVSSESNPLPRHGVLEMNWIVALLYLYMYLEQKVNTCKYIIRNCNLWGGEEVRNIKQYTIHWLWLHPLCTTKTCTLQLLCYYYSFPLTVTANLFFWSYIKCSLLIHVVLMFLSKFLKSFWHFDYILSNFSFHSATTNITTNIFDIILPLMLILTEKGLGCISTLPKKFLPLEIVSAGDHCDRSMSRQMLPLLLMFGW